MGNSPGKNSQSSIELSAGYRICRVINGCWQLAQGHGGNQDTVAALQEKLQRLVDAGFTSFDCADIYTGVERRLGEFRQSVKTPGKLQIHTKYVPDLDQLQRLTAADIRSGIERSLRRLRVDCLDLVQFHWWDYSVPGYLDALQVLDDLRCEGKIRGLGLTNFDARRVGEIIQAGLPIESLQLQYSLLDRRPEMQVSMLCQRHNISLICYGVLAGGLLSDRYLGQSRPQPDNRSMIKYLLMIDEIGGWATFQKLLIVLRRIADRHTTEISTVAAAWVLSQPGVAAVIMGVGRHTHIDSRTRVLNLRLDKADHTAITTVLNELDIPEGDVFELERSKSGPHAAIMKTNLNQEFN